MAINLSKTEEELTAEVMGKINLSKDKDNLQEHVVNLSKSIVELSKKEDFDLGNTKSRVVVVLDYSGSMSNLYSNGSVQETLTKLIPLGITFDDNGSIDVLLFQSGCTKLEDLTIDNYENYVKEVIDTSKYEYGGTYYAPVIGVIANGGRIDCTKVIDVDKTESYGFLGLKKRVVTEKVTKQDKDNIDALVDEEQPTFVLFITDGDNFDKENTDKIIREISERNMFIQFVGIGSDKFKYLEKLDELSGRKVDNTGFVKFESIEKADDSKVYKKVLKEYTKWLKNYKH